MKIVWTDTDSHRANLELSKQEIIAIRHSLETAETDLLCYLSTNDVHNDDFDENKIKFQVDHIAHIKSGFDNILNFMDDGE